MKAVEFESTLDACGCISVPAEAAREIPPGERVRVVVMWAQPVHAPEDSVYEQLIDDASLR